MDSVFGPKDLQRSNNVLENVKGIESIIIQIAQAQAKISLILIFAHTTFYMYIILIKRTAKYK